MIPIHLEKVRMVLLFGALVIHPSTVLAQDASLGVDRWNRVAIEWIQLMNRGDFQGAGAQVDPAVPDGVMGPDQLALIWGQLSAQLGALENLEPGRITEHGEYHSAFLPASFENQSLLLQVTLTDSLRVSGLHLQAPEPPPYEVPPYVDESSFLELDLTVGAEPWLLPAVLTVPRGDGPFPVVVLVHGSGPNDMDETIGGSRPFRDLAWGLATKGISVLRYDKRTNAHGSSVPADIGLEDEVIHDALAAIDLARNRAETDADRVFLLGHSLGGMLAPEIARQDGTLTGAAILAAPARPFFEVLTGQLQYLASLNEEDDPQGRAQFEALLALVRGVQEGTTPDDEVVLGAPPPYWRELAKVDPVATAKGLATPLLIMQGGRDYQSTSEDFSIWEKELEGRPEVGTRYYPDLNHLFAGGSGMATPEEYVSGASYVAEEVMEDLVRWILQKGG
jgi:alpha-beta hydrolase superfamily lysophospholipase